YKLRTNIVQQRERRSTCADKNLREHPHLRSKRDVNLRLDRIFQAIVTRIGNNSDNLPPAIASVNGTRIRRLVLKRSDTDLVADGIAVRPILTRQRFIHYSDHC